MILYAKYWVIYKIKNKIFFYFILQKVFKYNKY